MLTGQIDSTVKQQPDARGRHVQWPSIAMFSGLMSLRHTVVDRNTYAVMERKIGAARSSLAQCFIELFQELAGAVIVVVGQCSCPGVPTADAVAEWWSMR